MTSFKNSGLMKAVTFSYDDGVTQDVQLIELMNQYNLKGTFNLNSHLFGQGKFLCTPNHRYCHYRIRKEDVKELYQGHEIAAHTLTHPNLSTLEDKQIIYEVEQDRLNLSEIAGYEVVGMAYPFGDAGPRVADLIREGTGIRYCRTVRDTGSFQIPDNLYLLHPTSYHHNFSQMTQLAHQLIEAKPTQPQVFYIWGHSYEQDGDSRYWTQLEEFFRLISGHDDIYYGTNAQVLL